MDKKLYAFSHPGKIGDAFYALPTIRRICKDNNAEAVFYTSSYCEPMRKTMLYQSCIVDFIIPDNYQVEHFGCGGQPWQMPIDTSKYEKVHQLGFHTPINKSLHKVIAEAENIHDIEDPYYEYPETYNLDYDYAIINTNYTSKGFNPYIDNLYYDFVCKSPIKCVQFGREGDQLSRPHDNLVSFMGIDMLDTLSLMAKAKLYIGVMTGTLVLANGFPNLKKIIINNDPFEILCGLHTPSQIYMSNPNSNDLLGHLS